MRIVAGRHRGRRLSAPPGSVVRPTADRVRASIFNVLVHGRAGLALDGAVVLDVFAGTGAFGLEALSRGARHATFIDNDGSALAALRKNVAALGEAERAALLRLDATAAAPPPLAARAPADVVFLDAPYQSGASAPALAGLARRGWIAAGARCVVELGRGEPFAPPAGFTLIDERAWGRTRVAFLEYGG